MTAPQPDLSQPFAWQAPEGVQTTRGSGWYALFSFVTISLLLLAIFIIKSTTFAVLLLVMAIAIILLVSTQPRVINYAISAKGVYVGDHLYDFSEFRGFGLLQERGVHSALLLPVKRFSPGVTIYFSEAEGELIVDMLGARLPMQDIKPDALEKVIRFIKL